MIHLNQFVIINKRGEVVSIFNGEATYTDRVSAIIAGQNFCRDFYSKEGHIIFFRTVHPV